MNFIRDLTMSHISRLGSLLSQVKTLFVLPSKYGKLRTHITKPHCKDVSKII